MGWVVSSRTPMVARPTDLPQTQDVQPATAETTAAFSASLAEVVSGEFTSVVAVLLERWGAGPGLERKKRGLPHALISSEEGGVRAPSLPVVHPNAVKTFRTRLTAFGSTYFPDRVSM